MAEKGINGLCSDFELSCKLCVRSQTMRSSRDIGRKNCFSDINRRAVVAGKFLGLGLSSLGKLCAHLELPPPF